jgi:hypothetical protein
MGVVRAMFIDPPYAADAKPVRSPLSWNLVLGGCAAAVLFFGLRPQAVIDWSLASIQLFRG